MENPVRATTFFVVKNAQDVTINREKVNALAKQWAQQKITAASWPKQYHLQTEDKRAMLDYVILLDALNFCFWSKKEKWHIAYKGKWYSEYFALSLSLKKFFEENPTKANLLYFATVPFRQFCSILAGKGELLLTRKRWQIAKAMSAALRGDSTAFVHSADQKCSVLVSKIQKELPFFDDTVLYRQKRIYFLKRAQILVSDIWGAFYGKGIGRFEDLFYLTAFADYKIPQILYHKGILEYSPGLEKRIAQRTRIPQASRQEIEIRSCTIWAVEYLQDALERYGKKFCPMQIDWLLWNRSKEMDIRTLHHVTKTIYY